MKISYQRNLLLFICSCVMANSVYADSLGRIFTTADERQVLEKIRQTKEEPTKVETVKIEEFLEPEVEKEIIIRDAITLKGLVHRSDGKNTAWVNDSNTFEGDLESQFIQVPDNEIKSDQVTIIMSDNSTHLELRVGEVFNPEPLEKEIVETVKTEDDK